MSGDPKAVVVDLTEDTDDEVEETSSTKRQRRESVTVEAPIKLHATSADESERRRRPQSHCSWTQCKTMREMLGVDQKTIQWGFFANYLVEFDFLLDEVPELLSIPNLTVLFGDGNPSSWKMAGSKADFVEIRPSDDPGPTNPLRSKIPYGVHHSKLFLIGYTDGTCRVVVSTANIRAEDYKLKAQAAYIEDFPLKISGSEMKGYGFESTLVDYIRTYKYEKTKTWLTENETIANLLSHYDFSSAQGVLIPSVPGYHKLTEVSHLYGHLQLRKALTEHTKPSPGKPIVCQFSSMGSLTAKYLGEQIRFSMDTEWCRIRGKVPPKDIENLRLVYPSAGEIRDSIQGYPGGGTVPGREKNVERPFLQPLYRKWSSCKASKNPLWKGDHVPHIKTYCQPSGDGALEWFCISSHNLSKAAWGEVQNTKFGRRLFVRHWELGVLVTPSLLKVDAIVPFHEQQGAPRNGTAATIPIPFPVLDLERYDNNDQPWAVDGVYARADRFGRRSIYH